MKIVTGASLTMLKDRQNNGASLVALFKSVNRKLVYKPGGQTICAGFMGCADTMAGSKGGPSNSNMESCITSHTH